MRLRDLVAATIVVCLPIGAGAEILLVVLTTVAARIDPPVRARGVATTYWRGDGMSGRHLGCVAAARRLIGHHNFSDDLPVIATRYGPSCGTAVLVENVRTGRRTWAVKLDSGPYGQNCPDGWRAGKRLGPGCRWRGVADLSLRVAREIGHDGWDTVRLRWWTKRVATGAASR